MMGWSPGRLRALVRDQVKFSTRGEDARLPDVGPHGILDLSASKRSVWWEDVVLLEDQGKTGAIAYTVSGQVFQLEWPSLWAEDTRRGAFELMLGWWTAGRAAADRLRSGEMAV